MNKKYVPKIGFCCKWLPPDIIHDPRNKLVKELQESHNQKGTTISALKKLTRDQAFDRIQSLLIHNIRALEKQLTWVSRQHPAMRMMRIGSEFVPGATEITVNWIWQHPEIQKYLETNLSRIGEFARKHGIRLTMHPGQFCIFNSINPDVVTRAIEEFEYHTRLMEMMGYGTSWHDHGTAINIHVGSKIGSMQATIDTIENKLSASARNLITLENDEFSYGIDDMIEHKLYEKVAIVLDIHHHLIHSQGEYILPNDPRIDYIKHSWRDVRPLGHFSTSHEAVLAGHYTDELPDIAAMIQDGSKTKSDLRAHSNHTWNKKSNEWAISHLEWMDIEVEAKNKNLASENLFIQAKAMGVYE